MAQSLVARSMPPNSFLNRQQNSRGPPMGSSLGFQNRGSTRGARSGGRGTPQSPGAILALTPALGATEAVGARIPCHLVRSTGTTAGIRDLSTHHRAVSYLADIAGHLMLTLPRHRAFVNHPLSRLLSTLHAQLVVSLQSLDQYTAHSSWGEHGRYVRCSEHLGMFCLTCAQRVSKATSP